MSVITEISIEADEFGLGRVMPLDGDETVELESLVPAGESAMPFVWVYDVDFDSFEGYIRDHERVAALSRIDQYSDRTLYKFHWDVEDDCIFRDIQQLNGYILSATGTSESWRFELRFPSHDSMSEFQDHCDRRGVDFEVIRVYNPSKPDLGPWFGLTERQREAIVLAVEKGYYDIPRGCTTVELADELGISDQAVTERLRRAIVTLVSNTIITTSET